MTFSADRVLGYPPNFREAEFARFNRITQHDKVLIAWVLQILRGVVFKDTPISIIDLKYAGDSLSVWFSNNNASRWKSTEGFKVSEQGLSACCLSIDRGFPPNFPPNDFLRGGAVKMTDGSHLRNLKALAWMLQTLRQYLWYETPIFIINAYRNLSEYHRLLRAGFNPSLDSFHNSGLGVDIVVHERTAKLVQDDIKRLKLPFAVGLMSASTHLNPETKGYRDFPY
jgi:hypothetical protein